MKHQKWYRLEGQGLTTLLIVFAGILFYMVLTHLRLIWAAISAFLDVLIPFIAGFAIAYLLNTPTNFFEEKVYHRLKHRRMLSILTVFVIALAIIVILLRLVLPQVGNSLSQLVENFSYYLSNLDRMIRELVEKLDLENEANITTMLNNYNDTLRELAKAVTSAAPDLLNFGMAVGNGVVTGVTALISAIYMLAGKARLIRQLKKLIYAVFPVKGVSHILSVSDRANQIFVGFINGKLLDSAIIGVLCFVLTAILRIPYGILVSVIVGMTNIIPFFGPIIGAVPCLMLLIIVDPWAALRFGILIIGLRQFDGNILGPKILGDSTGLSAIWVLVAIVVGGGLFSFPGMLLGVPTFAVLYSLVREWADMRLAQKGIDANGEPVAPPEDEFEPESIPED